QIWGPGDRHSSSHRRGRGRDPGPYARPDALRGATLGRCGRQEHLLDRPCHRPAPEEPATRGPGSLCRDRDPETVSQEDAVSPSQGCFASVAMLVALVAAPPAARAAAPITVS